MNSAFAILSLIVAIPFLGTFFVLTSRNSDIEISGKNAFNVCVFTIIANIIMIWRIFMILDEDNHSLQLIEKFNWLNTPEINIIFGVDPFSLLLILGVHIAVLIALSGVKNNTNNQKTLMVYTLLFLSISTGFFISADIFSFYIFFEAMLIPHFMIIGIFGEVKKQGAVSRFFLYNFIGALILFIATMAIYHYYGNVSLDKVSSLPLKGKIGFYVWGAICLSFLFRIPIWPFHYWISSINSGIRNPLAFSITCLIPLTGLYGFIRFLPPEMPSFIAEYIMWGNVIGVITMLFIALIGFINKDVQYKIFAYTTVYYIMYLLGIFTGDDEIFLNVGFSMFAFLIIIASLEVLSSYIFHKEQENAASSQGFLCHARRLSYCYSILVLAAVGLPLSSMFVNNFLIVSKLLSSNLKMGILIIFSLALVGVALLQEVFRLKLDNKECSLSKDDDISKGMFALMLFIIFILLMSFVKPLWFVIDE